MANGVRPRRDRPGGMDARYKQLTGYLAQPAGTTPKAQAKAGRVPETLGRVEARMADRAKRPIITQPQRKRKS